MSEPQTTGHPHCISDFSYSLSQVSGDRRPNLSQFSTLAPTPSRSSDENSAASSTVLIWWTPLHSIKSQSRTWDSTGGGENDATFFCFSSLPRTIKIQSFPASSPACFLLSLSLSLSMAAEMNISMQISPLKCAKTSVDRLASLESRRGLWAAASRRRRPSFSRRLVASMKLTEKSESSDLAAVNGPLDLVSSCSRFLLPSFLSFFLFDWVREKASNEWFEEKRSFLLLLCEILV